MTVRSMTGYGSAARETDELSAQVAVRSLNHRYLDLAVHAPRRFASLEPALKEHVQGRVRRGKVELWLRAALRKGDGQGVSAVPQVVAGLVRALREARSEHGLSGEVSVSDVARFPGAFELVESVAEADVSARALVLDLVGQALDGLDAMRREEGARLAHELRRLLDAIHAAAQRLAELWEAGREQRRGVLRERAQALCAEIGLDESRLHAELARLLDRSDVAEELQRLHSHVAQSRGLLEGAEPCGKRLDFLAQELMREANTLGSKAVSAAMVQEVVALKSEIERLREQVQNLE